MAFLLFFKPMSVYFFFFFNILMNIFLSLTSGGRSKRKDSLAHCDLLCKSYKSIFTQSWAKRRSVKINQSIPPPHPCLRPPRGRFFWAGLGHPLTADWCKRSSIYSFLRWHWSCTTPRHKLSSRDWVWRRQNLWCFCYCCYWYFVALFSLGNQTPVFFFFASNLGRRKKSKQKTALSLATVHIHIIIIIWKLKWWQWGGGLRLPDAELISGSGNERTNALLVYTVDEHFRIESGLIQFQLTVKVSENSFLCYIPECF